MNACGATDALVATGALDPASVNRVERRLLEHDVHVRLSCGLRGITQQHLVPAPLARADLLHHTTRDAKLASTCQTGRRPHRRDHGTARPRPVLGVIAIAISWTRRALVLFRQDRGGRGSAPLVIYRFGTMAADAEASQALLRTRNERTGPLFKLAGDPR